MALTLQQKQQVLEESSNNIIIPRIPIIIKLEVRSFPKISRNARRPFDPGIMTLMSQTMSTLLTQVEGSIFGYQYSDKIILILKNDQSPDTEPWFNNKVQDIASVTSSIATHAFLSNFMDMENAPELDGPVLFKSTVFGTSGVSDCISYMIYRQLRCMHDSLNLVCYDVLKERFGNSLYSYLEDKGIDDRLRLLQEEKVDYENDYPNIIRLGIAAYLTPYLHESKAGKITKHRWFLDSKVPVFSENRDFLKTIFTTGSDIFRSGRDFD